MTINLKYCNTCLRHRIMKIIEKKELMYNNLDYSRHNIYYTKLYIKDIVAPIAYICIK